MEVTWHRRKFRAEIVFENAPVQGKLWLKWKGRKAAVGWNAIRQFHTRYDHATGTRTPMGKITFVCKDESCYPNMTPEIIQDIVAMITMLKEVPYK